MTRPLTGFLAAFAVLAVIATTRVAATTVPPLTFDEIVKGANEIFVGEVVARASRYVQTRDGRAIVTLVTFKVDESLKGDLQTQTSIEFLGGTVGDETMEVVGMPEFRVGDRDVLFVGDRASVSPITGFMQGRFRIARDPVRGVDTVRWYDGRSIATIADIGQPRLKTMQAVPSVTLSDFRAAIRSRLPGAGGGR